MPSSVPRRIRLRLTQYRRGLSRCGSDWGWRQPATGASGTHTGPPESGRCGGSRWLYPGRWSRMAVPPPAPFPVAPDLHGSGATGSGEGLTIHSRWFTFAGPAALGRRHGQPKKMAARCWIHLAAGFSGERPKGTCKAMITQLWRSFTTKYCRRCSTTYTGPVCPVCARGS